MTIDEWKTKIKESISQPQQQKELCEQLLSMAKERQDHDSAAFAYLWLADYYFYNDHNIRRTEEFLYQAYYYLSKEVTQDFVKYYLLKAYCYRDSYDSIEQMNCYLKAFNAAEVLEMKEEMAIIYGNVADLLQVNASYEKALYYNLKAYDLFEDLDNYATSGLFMLLSNIIHGYYKQGKYQPMQPFLRKMEHIDWNSSLRNIVLDYAFLRYYCTKQDNEMTALYLQSLLSGELNHVGDKMFSYEVLSTMAECALITKQEEMSLQILERLSSLFTQDDIEPWLDIQRFWIRYYNMAGKNEQLEKQLKYYYHISREIISHNNMIKINGLRVHIGIRDMENKGLNLNHENEVLADAAMKDNQTGLYNRRYMNRIIDNFRNYHEWRNIGFVILDIDYFKEYNDFYGHLAGDQVLYEIAMILHDTSNEMFIPCRFGGDEFLLICKNVSDDQIEFVIQSMMKQLSRKQLLHEKSKCDTFVTLSIGYGNKAISHDLDVYKFLDEIDETLYISKKSGRNKYTKLKDKGGM